MAKDQTHTHQHNQPQDPNLLESKQIDFTVAWDEVEKAINKVLRKYQPHVKNDGFRKGKVPLHMVMNLVGQDTVYQEAAQLVVPQAFANAYQKAKVQGIGEPDIHIEKMEEGRDWSFHAHIAEKPEIKLGKFQSKVQKALKEARKSLEKLKPEELKKREKLTPEQREQQDRETFINAALTSLRESFNPKVPELLVRQEMNRSLQQMEQQLKQLNIDPKSYLKSLNQTVEQLQQEHAARAFAAWQVEFIIDAIGDEQKIEMTDQEIFDKLEINPKERQLEPSELEHYRSVLRKQKVLDYLLTLE